MKQIGFVILAIGALILGYSGFVGLGTGLDGFRVANFGGMFIGMALLISGSIFAVGGAILEQLRPMNVQASSETVKNYKGYQIRKALDWASTGDFLVGNTRVQGMMAAEEYIDRQLGGHE